MERLPKLIKTLHLFQQSADLYVNEIVHMNKQIDQNDFFFNYMNVVAGMYTASNSDVVE